MKTKKLILFGLLALIGLDISAQEMVKDIRTGVSSGISLSASLVNVNGTLFFMANNGTNGEELWKSDGTAAGTAMVKDIKPGASGSTAGSSPSILINVNGTLFFVADDGTNGAELWKSDGTNAGTVMVKDIFPGSNGSNPYPNSTAFINFNGTLYFSADDGTNGEELWKSDGTAAGTAIVKDIKPGANVSNIAGFTNLNGTLYFAADDGTNGKELWKSDGTTAGTVIVKDILPGSNDSNPRGFTNLNGTIYFEAFDGTNGAELWKSDGTIAGTVMVKDIQAGSNSSEALGFINVNGILYFWADDGSNGFELWKSDGTTAGTVMVKDIWTGNGSSHPSHLTEFNGQLYFSADDSTNGTELWTSDGTTVGTVMAKDIKSGSGGSNPFNFISLNNTLYFGADDGVVGVELWKSDGTTTGTVMVKDIYTGAGNSNPSGFIEVNGTLYFNAYNYYGRELWKLAGTTSVREISSITPTDFSLAQNYPNPFNPTTTIRYDIPKSGFVKISVYDILGKEIKILVNEEKNPGSYEITFDAKILASGIYYYTISTGEFNQSRKMILMK